MPRYAIIKNGTVQNITEATNEFGASMGWIVANETVQIGWVYDPVNNKFSPFVDSENDLREAREKKNIEINEARLKANFDSFMFKGKRIATDALSRSDIDGTNGTVTLTQNFPQGWPGAWKAMDDSYISIKNVAEWTEFYLAFCGQGTLNFAHAQELKTAVKNASSIAEIESIKW